MKYTVKVIWNKLPEESFIDNKYSRLHQWNFDGGIELKASSSPNVVPLPMSDASAVDPEEAFVASISSCHMLWFLSLAASQKYIVESYSDEAEGIMNKNLNGDMAMTSVTLKPIIKFIGSNIPSFEEINDLHEKAHKKCFIANSVKTEIKIIQS